MSTIVANLEPVTLSGLDEVKVLTAFDFAKDNIAYIKAIRRRRNNGAQLARLNLSTHGMTTGAELYRLTFSQFVDIRSRPPHMLMSNAPAY